MKTPLQKRPINIEKRPADIKKRPQTDIISACKQILHLQHFLDSDERSFFGRI